ncbi:MAG: hypothetical protein GKR89_26050 [Candidatus Latescibacteria bacterium]|nr:hypothetical protein [Candidatus Latescibacterota bacterium]
MLKKLAITAYEWANLCGRPAHLPPVLRALRGRTYPVLSDAQHLAGALDWLLRAQDISGDGVSAGYFFRRGWAPPYPETSGYIIPTLLRAAALPGRTDLIERAQRIGQWEIELQLPSGAVRGGIGRKPHPIVFNTGQVILGWLALYRHFHQDHFLAAATRAADWLLEIQDADGKWSAHTFMNRPRAYHSRVAWPLLELYAATGYKKYYAAARRNIAWVLDQSRDDGWIDHMQLYPEVPPFTHTIAYTLRGLYEAAPYLDDALAQAALSLVRQASKGLLANCPKGALPPATWGPGWRPCHTSSCLTGNAQLALLWQRWKDRGEAGFAPTAQAWIEQLKGHQHLTARHPGLRGGLPGSSPLWGVYLPWAVPNWAAKFFADALLENLLPPVPEPTHFS